MPNVSVFGPLDAYSVLGQLTCEVCASLLRKGWNVAIKPLSLVEEKGGAPIPVPLELKEHIQAENSARLELLIAPMDKLPLPTAGKRTVFWPWLSNDQLDRKQAAVLSRSELLLANSEWSDQAFINVGWNGPISRVSVGIPGGLFQRSPKTPADACVFGVGGPGLTDEHQDYTPLIRAFLEAFPGIPDVMLRVYDPFGAAIDVNDGRVKFDLSFQPPIHLCRWFHSLDAYVHFGDGRPIGQMAMASGRPIVGWDHAYPVSYPIHPTADQGVSLVEQLRRVYLDRIEAVHLGEVAALAVELWSDDTLDNILRTLC